MTRCICKTIKGTQCSRPATTGSSFCSSHQKCIAKVASTKTAEPTKKVPARKVPTKKVPAKKTARSAKKIPKNTKALKSVWLVVFVHSESNDDGPFGVENISLEDAYTTKEAAEREATKLAREHDVKVVGEPYVDNNDYVDVREIKLK